MDLSQECAHDVGGPASRSHLPWCGVKITLTGVSERAAGRKVERARHAVGTSVAILQHVGSDDEPSPREQPLRGGKSFGGKTECHRAARLGEQPRKGLRREPLVRSCHGEQDRIHRQRVDAIKGASNESSEAPGFRSFYHGQQRTWRIVLTREDQSVDASATGVEQIAPSLRGHVDVGHQGEPGQALLDLSESLEVRRSAPIQVEHSHTDGFPVADAHEGRPVRTLLKLMAVA
ncbi:hypothetical protein BH11GEM2_BH11GEM2_18520 [soil metagenome]